MFCGNCLKQKLYVISPEGACDEQDVNSTARSGSIHNTMSPQRKAINPFIGGFKMKAKLAP